MRSLLCLLLLVCSSALVLSAPSNGACPSLPASLELRASSEQPHTYQLVFVLDSKTAAFPDYVDIHYRINNDDATNLRAISQMTLPAENRARQTQVDGIVMKPGDTLRSYATYSYNGYNCDTDVHAFTAPYDDEYEKEGEHSDMRVQAILPAERQEQSSSKQEQNGACPAIQYSHKVKKMAKLENTYLLQFENLQPEKQLDYLDLHLQLNGGNMDNLRLASQMQLTHASSVLQPGIVVGPKDTLSYFWTYRVQDASGKSLDCSTEMFTVKPEDVKEEWNPEQQEQAQAQAQGQLHHDNNWLHQQRLSH